MYKSGESLKSRKGNIELSWDGMQWIYLMEWI